MHLVQLFLPLRDNAGNAFDKALFDEVRATLAGRFGGSTAFVRAPATGLWEGDGGQLERDELVLVEVQVEVLDHAWWRDYRQALERRFRQDSLLVRALPAQAL